jgi:diguanylate cyclase (GGDEF)-like protein
MPSDSSSGEIRIRTVEIPTADSAAPVAPLSVQLSGFLASFDEEEDTDILQSGDSGLRPISAGEHEYALTVLSGSQTGLHRTIDKEVIVVGRSPDCDFQLADTALSRRHCRIHRTPEGLIIEDLDSSNGTFVDGKQVQGRQRIAEGARIHLGRQTVLALLRQDPLAQQAARQLYESAMRDPLTGVYNRRYLDQRLQEEFAYAQRHASSLSLIILDLDHFKRINDTHGHPAGDAVLRHVGVLVPRYLRREDVAARYGGEELAVLARSIGSQGARSLGERIRRRVADTPVVFDGHTLAITTSVGIATFSPAKSYDRVGAFLAAADQALYRAKQGGRNRCEDDR